MPRTVKNNTVARRPSANGTANSTGGSHKPRKQTGARTVRLPLIKGSGDYTVFDLPEANELDRRVKQLERKTANSLGKTLGSGLGGLVGLGDLGGTLGSAVENWFGHGDYQLQSNSLIDAVTNPKSSAIPTFSNSKRGLRVTEREYIGDVFSGALFGPSSSFDLKTFAINPGDRNTFPWLSTIASQFEQWDPHGIIFEFKSTSSSYNGSSQALGTIIMATDYDPTDAVYPDKITMETSDYSNSSKASESLIHGVECAVEERPTKTFLVRLGSPPAGESLKFYDLATFQIATQGMSAAGVNLGELWVSYDITFYKKQAEPLFPGFYLDALTPTTANPFSIISTRAAFSGLEMSVTGRTVTFPAQVRSGRYLVAYWVSGSSSMLAPPPSALNNCTLVSQQAISGSPPPGVNLVLNLFDIKGPSASFTVNYTLTSSAESFLAVTQVHPKFIV